MEELFVSPSLVRRLNEIGFDEPCIARWNKHTNTFITIATPKQSEIANSSLIALPTPDQVLDWLKREKKIWIEPVSKIIDQKGNVKTKYRFLQISPPHIEFKHANFSMRDFTVETIGEAFEKVFEFLK